MDNGQGFSLLSQELKSLKELMDTKLEQVLANQKVQTERINKRELESESLERRFNESEKSMDKRINDNTREIDKLKTSKNTMVWIVTIGIAGAGAIGAILAAIIPALIAG